MGSVPSGTSLPSGEHLFIQEPQCCSGGKIKFSFQCQSQPASLAAVPSDKWSTFQSAVDEQARQIFNNEMSFLFFIPGAILSHVVPGIAGMAISIIFLVGAIGGGMFAIKKNQERDNTISNLCAQFSSETGTGLQYHTEYTGFCKPRGAQTVRVIVIMYSPSAAGPATIGAQMMSVQVPPGATAGQTLQIQTATGPMNVVIPEGVSEGQNFSVQVPAAAPTVQAIPTVQATPVTVQATPVQATPVAKSGTATPTQVSPEVDEDNPNMEVGAKVKEAN